MSVLGHYQILEAHSFPRASLLENCSPLGRNNFRTNIQAYIFFGPNGEYCLFTSDFLEYAFVNEKKKKIITYFSQFSYALFVIFGSFLLTQSVHHVFLKESWGIQNVQNAQLTVSQEQAGNTASAGVDFFVLRGRTFQTTAQVGKHFIATVLINSNEKNNNNPPRPRPVSPISVMEEKARVALRTNLSLIWKGEGGIALLILSKIVDTLSATK